MPGGKSMKIEGLDAATRLHDLADVLRPWAIRAAATLHLADHIAAGHRSVDELARVSHSNADALGRLLRYLETQGLFVEEPVGHYELTDVGAVLREGHPAQLRSWLDQDGGMGRADIAAAGLLESVRSGVPAYSRFFGCPFWDDLEHHPDRRRAFDELMREQLDLQAPHIAAAYDWGDVREVVDVGGGTGILLAAILERAAHVRGTLVELPRTTEQARTLIHARGLSDRATVIGRSFFEPLPPGADVYILNNVLHDWPDADAITILKGCAEAAAPTGRVLVIESPREPRGNSLSSLFSTMDLYMLVLFGGRQRSLEELDDKFRSSGLRRSRIAGTVGSRYLIECSNGVVAA
jgi:2,7-dihydroxy-5-methyl-1-naphthoate 7-O-methyltransferase